MIRPPDDPFCFPAPPGADESELSDLAAAAPTTSLGAWRAIRDKLDAIYGEKRGQVGWFKSSVTFEAGDSIGDGLTKFGLSGKVKLSFEADSTGEIKLAPVEREVEVSGMFHNVVVDAGTGEITEVGLKPEFEDEEIGAKKVSVGVKFNGDQVMTEVSAQVGPYGLSFDHKGKVTIKTKLVDVSGNVHEGRITISKEYSFKEAIEEAVKEANGGAKPPWFDRMPDVKFQWEVGAQVGDDASDIMRVIGKYPGLWDLRPRSEFEKLHWNASGGTRGLRLQRGLAEVPDLSLREQGYPPSSCTPPLLLQCRGCNEAKLRQVRIGARAPRSGVAAVRGCGRASWAAVDPPPGSQPPAPCFGAGTVWRLRGPSRFACGGRVWLALGQRAAPDGPFPAYCRFSAVATLSSSPTRSVVRGGGSNEWAPRAA